MFITKRRFLITILPTQAALSLCTRAFAQGAGVPLTPGCKDAHEPTVAQTAGPFYTASAPLKRDLTGDVADGQPITLAGHVLDTQCRPVPNAMVEIWHADRDGRYDTTGFALRGHQFTDNAGRWGFDTIVTQHYSFRTAHYHFRVTGSRGRSLTTQLYFPDHPRNKGDSLFDPRLLLQMEERVSRRIGRFNFVV
jgi:protocatechuate 3,4-dioxygenase beta subunit